MSQARISPTVRRTAAVVVGVAIVAVGWRLYDTDVHSHSTGRLGVLQTGIPTGGPTASSAATTGGQSGQSVLNVVAVSSLPPEGRDTLLVIQAGRPYPSAADGATFENRQHLLPDHQTGYYREFTVATPGSSGRDTRWIIVGQNGELYYSDDDQNSFVRIAE